MDPEIMALLRSIAGNVSRIAKMMEAHGAELTRLTDAMAGRTDPARSRDAEALMGLGRAVEDQER